MAERVEATHAAGHREIHDHEIVTRASGQGRAVFLDRLGPVHRAVHRQAEALQQHHGHVADDLLVIHEEHAPLHPVGRLPRGPGIEMHQVLAQGRQPDAERGAVPHL